MRKAGLQNVRGARYERKEGFGRSQMAASGCVCCLFSSEVAGVHKLAAVTGATTPYNPSSGDANCLPTQPYSGRVKEAFKNMHRN